MTTGKHDAIVALCFPSRELRSASADEMDSVVETIHSRGLVNGTEGFQRGDAHFLEVLLQGGLRCGAEQDPRRRVANVRPFGQFVRGVQKACKGNK